MKNRRIIPRWKIDRQAKIKLAGAEAFVDCSIKDINFKGAQIYLGLRLPADKFLKCHLQVSEECAFNVEAWVVWHKIVGDSNCYGLYFSKVRDADKEKIYRFTHSNCPEQISKQYCQATEKEGGELMEKQDMEDKRIFERFLVKLPLRFLDLNNNKEGQANTEDVSAKGIGLVTNEELQPASPLELWLQMPDKGEPLYARGNVVWSNMVSANEYRAGVNLEKADLMGLSRALRVR